MNRILVCGGRYYKDQDTVNKTLFDITGLRDQYNFGTIIHGNARGADSLGASWGYRMGWKVEAYPADWKQYGKKAGYLRNKQMLDEGKPDLVVAFPGGKGTAMMIKLAKEASIEVREVNGQRNTDD